MEEDPSVRIRKVGEEMKKFFLGRTREIFLTVVAGLLCGETLWLTRGESGLGWFFIFITIIWWE